MWNVEKTWDKMAYRDLQFYRNELTTQEEYMGAIRKRDTTDFASTPYRSISDMACSRSTYMLRDHGVAFSGPSLCQFGLMQHIPDVVKQLARIERASKRRCDWSHELNTYIHRWDDRTNEIQRQRSSLTVPSDYIK